MAIGKGLFTSVNTTGTESDPRTWAMTPKYTDPYAKDAKRRMAKFVISTDLRSAIDDSSGKAGGDTNAAVQANDVLKHLSNLNRGYFDFFLQGVEESFEEKYQIIETLGDSYAAFGLGKRPKIWSYSGVLLNSEENDWRLNFMKLFEEYISISSLAKFKKGSTINQVNLLYDTLNVRGALLNLRTSMNAANEMAVPFAFTMLITKITPTSVLGSTTGLTDIAPTLIEEAVFTEPENTLNTQHTGVSTNQLLAYKI